MMKSILGFMMLSLLLAACSNDDQEDKPEPSEDTVQEDPAENNAVETNDHDSDSEESEDNEKREHIENQKGLKIGETGTVVSSKEKYTYEVTLDNVYYQDIEDLKLFNEVFVVVELTIKNVDDQAFNAESTFTPSIGELGTNKYTIPVGNEFQEEIPGVTNIEGELRPGESITGHYVYDIDKFENYQFTFGNKWDDITTIAAWEFSEDEME